MYLCSKRDQVLFNTEPTKKRSFLRSRKHKGGFEEAKFYYDSHILLHNQTPVTTSFIEIIPVEKIYF